MSQSVLPPWGIGNEFFQPEPAVPVVAGPMVAPVTVARKPVVVPAAVLGDVHVQPLGHEPRHHSPFRSVLELAHRHSLATFALLFLIVGVSAISVVGAYRSAQFNLRPTAQSTTLHVPAAPLQGPNLIITSDQLGETLQRIAGQPLNITAGVKNVPVSSDTIKSWLQITADKKQAVTYIHVNQAAINKSLSDLAAPYVKDPVNQVSVTHPDGSSLVIAAGRDGSTVGDLAPLDQQIGQNLLGAKGLQLTLPIETKAFAITPASDIAKLIEVNLATKQMYLYDHGQFYKNYLVSAGAPATPTPVGQFKIFEKLPVQDMKGVNINGTPYFQPHVHWINYFLAGGYAVHGVYWHGSGWFGNINSSHGCVGIPDEQAKEVYDWAPIGTTVITHY